MRDQVLGERREVGRLKKERWHQRQVVGFVDGIGQSHKTDRVKPVVGKIPCRSNLLCRDLLDPGNDLHQTGLHPIERFRLCRNNCGRRRDLRQAQV